ncbi:hypothetical protein AB0K02_06745 [Streptomyces sp. NPDC049597]|uniref:hypothetical protein n=1 Tax=Streptomyces sp. NPDC049597 TaxID=3155276 RepID=UPI0034425F87
MTSAALSPAAVLCALRRAVAGSRALRVLLLLAGLLTLGLLCGGQAHAVEAHAEVRAEVGAEAGAGADVRTGVVGRADVEQADGLGDTDGPDDPAGSLSPGQDAREQAAIRELRRAAEDTADSVREAVGSVVGTVRDLGGVLSGALPLPSPGELPAIPGGPGAAWPVTDIAPSAVPGGGLTALASVMTGDAGAAGRPDADARFGPAAGYDGRAWPGWSPDASAWPAVRPLLVPAPGQAPEPVRPCGIVPGTVQHSGENHMPRPGDQHAAAFADGARDALASGQVCPAAEPPTRDRPRDILEFPG